MSGRVFLGLTSTKQGLMCLAQGHKAVPPVRPEPATTRSRVKHSTTESHCIKPNIFANSPNKINIFVLSLSVLFVCLFDLILYAPSTIFQL